MRARAALTVLSLVLIVGLGGCAPEPGKLLSDQSRGPDINRYQVPANCSVFYSVILTPSAKAPPEGVQVLDVKLRTDAKTELRLFRPSASFSEDGLLQLGEGLGPLADWPVATVVHAAWLDPNASLGYLLAVWKIQTPADGELRIRDAQVEYRADGQIYRQWLWARVVAKVSDKMPCSVAERVRQRDQHDRQNDAELDRNQTRYSQPWIATPEEARIYMEMVHVIMLRERLLVADQRPSVERLKDALGGEQIDLATTTSLASLVGKKNRPGRMSLWIVAEPGRGSLMLAAASSGGAVVTARINSKCRANVAWHFSAPAPTETQGWDCSAELERLVTVD